MKVLIACEYTGITRDAFTALGNDAWSCDLRPTEREGQHYQGDVRDIIGAEDWDLMIAYPPCTHLAISGARWFMDKLDAQKEALLFVQELMQAHIPRKCIENPVSVISTAIRPPDQIIQPYMFGHATKKRICLWLTGLPLLHATTQINPKNLPVYVNKGAQHNRDRTFMGIAMAMASQWDH